MKAFRMPPRDTGSQAREYEGENSYSPLTVRAPLMLVVIPANNEGIRRVGTPCCPEMAGIFNHRPMPADAIDTSNDHGARSEGGRVLQPPEKYNLKRGDHGALGDTSIII